jgi:hypothetical protein
MPTRLSRAEVIVLLRKAETDSSPVELVCSGPSEPALYLIGFLSFDEEDAYVHVQVPNALGALFGIEDCESTAIRGASG